MPYFLNIVNSISIFLMLSVYFAYNVVNPVAKKNNPKIMHYEIGSYIYIGILAGLINIMNSINLSDAVFWYGVSLSFGIKSAIFIVVIGGILVGMSIYFSASDKNDIQDIEIIIKTLQESMDSIINKQLIVDEMSKDFKKRFSQIATPEEVDEKIREMVEDQLDDIKSDLQHLSDKTAIIAEQLVSFKKSEGNLPALMDNEDDDDDEDQDNTDEDDNSYNWDDDDNKKY